MTKKKYTIPYQYTIVAHATVYADSLEEAVALVQDGGPCPEPADLGWKDSEVDISKVTFSYLENSFEIHEDDLDLYGNPK
jgi:hypothetical protein